MFLVLLLYPSLGEIEPLTHWGLLLEDFCNTHSPQLVCVKSVWSSGMIQVKPARKKTKQINSLLDDVCKFLSLWRWKITAVRGQLDAALMQQSHRQIILWVFLVRHIIFNIIVELNDIITIATPSGTHFPHPSIRHCSDLSTFKSKLKMHLLNELLIFYVLFYHVLNILSYF